MNAVTLTADALDPIDALPRPPPWIDDDTTLLDLLAVRLARADGLDGLDRRAVDYAETLADLDVGPGDRVALDLYDDEEALAALIGILAVGAAVVLVAPDVEDELPLAASIGGDRPDVPRCDPEYERRRRTASVRVWPGADADDPALVLQWVDDDRQTRIETLDGRVAVAGLLALGDVCGGRTEVEGADLLRQLSALCRPTSMH